MSEEEEVDIKYVDTDWDNYYNNALYENDQWMNDLQKKMIILFFKKHYIKIKFILKKRINRMMINKLTDDGITLLHLATHLQDIILIDMLIKCGADPQILDKFGKPSTHYIVLNKNKYKQILYKMKNYLNSTDDDGNTLLHLAIGMDDVNLTKTLIRLGINTKIKNKNGYMACDFLIK
jgi:ankyrin repeat protein